MRSRLLDSDKTNERLRADLENKERELQREKHQNKMRETESTEKMEGLYHDLKTAQKTLEAVTADLESQAEIEQNRNEKQIEQLKHNLQNSQTDLSDIKRQRDILKQTETDMKEEISGKWLLIFMKFGIRVTNQIKKIYFKYNTQILVEVQIFGQ